MPFAVIEPGQRFCPLEQDGPAVLVPVNTVAPVVAIDLPPGLIGSTLSVTSNGSWSNSPHTFYYQWFRNSVVIEGASDVTYLLTVADADYDLTCQVTAVNDDGESEALSNAVVPAALTAPVISTSPLIDSPTVQQLVLLTEPSVDAGNPPDLTGETVEWFESPDGSPGSFILFFSGREPGMALSGFYYYLEITKTNATGTSAPARSNTVVCT